MQYLPSSHPPSVSVIVPRDHTFSAHPSFRPGPTFRNPQTCREWMGAHLPFRNTYHEGIYPLWNKHACLFCFDWWICTHDHIFTKSRSPLSPRILFLFSHIPTLCLLCSSYCYYPVSLFTPSILPHVQFLLARAS